MTGSELAEFNWLDYTIAGIIFLSTLISFIRGFVREAISLATWVVAAWVASSFVAPAANLLSQWIQTELLRLLIAFAVIFVTVLILGAMVNYVISQLIDKTGLSGTDRLLGSLFGSLRGVLLVAILLLLVQLATIAKQPRWLLASQLAPHFEGVSAWLQGFLPEQLADLSTASAPAAEPVSSDELPVDALSVPAPTQAFSS